MVGGWILGMILASWTKKGLEKTKIDNQIASWILADDSQAFPIENWMARLVFWVVFTFALVGFLETLQLTAVSQPLNSFLNEITRYAPRLISAGLLMLLAWLIATIVRAILVKGMERFKLDDQLAEQIGSESGAASLPVNETLGNVLYWFILLFFLPFVLDALELQGPLGPVQNLIDDLLSALPQIFKAVIVAFIGWGVATLVQTIVTKFLKATGVDQFGAQIGLGGAEGELSLSGLCGTLIYTVILVVTGISALDELQIAAISDPAVTMLEQILLAIPLVLKAGIILAIAFYIARFLVANLVTSLLRGLGFDNVLTWLGVQATVTPQTLESVEVSADAEAASPQKTPSEIAGIVAGVGVMLFGAVAAVDALQFNALTEIVSGLIEISGRILVGVVILGIGLYLSNLAFRLISMPGSRQSRFLAQAARVSILVLVIAMALQQMGVATNIVNLAFGLITGGIAVAIALAFGLGGREVAAEQLREWLTAFKQP
ncbi:MAG: mechanosensitive ion channel [Prochlorotrichaceae cyanobacterium]